MKKTIFWSILVFILGISPSYAGVRDFITTESTRNEFRQDPRGLTPNQRIQRNELKAELNPDLRGRWNPKSRQPASEGSYQTDNLAEKILANFKEDEELAKIPAKLKVSSVNGAVTLDGFVNNEDERNLIEDKVKKMEGVKKVINQLKIKTSNQDLLE